MSAAPRRRRGPTSERRPEACACAPNTRMTHPCPLERIVLASASPRRLQLLRSLGLQVETAISGYGEPKLDCTPIELAGAHARAKLEAVARTRGSDDPPIVAADTVVDVDGAAWGKPSDAREAESMLRTLSGRGHVVHTAFALAAAGTTVVETSSTLVGFYRLSEMEIAEYVASGEPFDKAGAYGIQGRAAALVERVDGDFYTVVGFPLARFVRALRRLGFSLPAANPTQLQPEA
ncbi:MAG TPA: nucleoside triphosphate pyrophosphatase [Candidatus Tumulicola sp.]